MDAPISNTSNGPIRMMIGKTLATLVPSRRNRGNSQEDRDRVAAAQAKQDKKTQRRADQKAKQKARAENLERIAAFKASGGPEKAIAEYRARKRV